MRAIVATLLLAFALAASAGTTCRTATATPHAIAAAAATARDVAAALDARDRPVALVARVGTDLSKYGLRYSHVGFVLRDHPDGRWTVVHELNTCGTARSALYAQGLVNFFLDDLVSQDAKIVWPDDATSAALVALLARDPSVVHEPRYSVIARVGSGRYQNSTAWVLETIAAAQSRAHERADAQRWIAAQGFEPDVLHIPYSQRVLGGLFSANAAFGDHPVAARLGGEYRVVTVRSIFRWLADSDRIAGVAIVGARGPD
jgi:hypothetical protein